jgi:hypothetical protein
MTVKDLIEELKKFPKDMKIVGQWNDVEYGYDISENINVFKKTVKTPMGFIV